MLVFVFKNSFILIVYLFVFEPSSRSRLLDVMFYNFFLSIFFVFFWFVGRVGGPCVIWWCTVPAYVLHDLNIYT